MREPAFWWREPSLASALLAPLAAAYGAVAQVRLERHGRRAGVPVVCIGNLTVGGAGKTPTALAVARMLADERPVFLSRGYGGALAGPVVVDPSRHRAREVGDEPLLLARAAPAIVARHRHGRWFPQSFTRQGFFSARGRRQARHRQRAGHPRRSAAGARRWAAHA